MSDLLRSHRLPLLGKGNNLASPRVFPKEQNINPSLSSHSVLLPSWTVHLSVYLSAQVDFWLRELRKSRAQEDVAIAVVGCKLDLIQKNPARRAVSQAEAESYCSRIDAKYFETSALTGENCNAPFEYLVDEFVLMRASRPELQKSHRDRIEVSAPSSSQSKCC